MAGCKGAATLGKSRLGCRGAETLDVDGVGSTSNRAKGAATETDTLEVAAAVVAGGGAEVKRAPTHAGGGTDTVALGADPFTRWWDVDFLGGGWTGEISLGASQTDRGSLTGDESSVRNETSLSAREPPPPLCCYLTGVDLREM